MSDFGRYYDRVSSRMSSAASFLRIVLARTDVVAPTVEERAELARAFQSLQSTVKLVLDEQTWTDLAKRRAEQTDPYSPPTVKEPE